MMSAILSTLGLMMASAASGHGAHGAAKANCPVATPAAVEVQFARFNEA
ncbi:MAG: hypothetical protein ACKOAN_09480 [Chakrabartia sp.]